MYLQPGRALPTGAEPAVMGGRDRAVLRQPVVHQQPPGTGKGGPRRHRPIGCWCWPTRSSIPLNCWKSCARDRRDRETAFQVVVPASPVETGVAPPTARSTCGRDSGRCPGTAGQHAQHASRRGDFRPRARWRLPATARTGRRRRVVPPDQIVIADRATSERIDLASFRCRRPRPGRVRRRSPTSSPRRAVGRAVTILAGFQHQPPERCTDQPGDPDRSQQSGIHRRRGRGRALRPPRSIRSKTST